MSKKLYQASLPYPALASKASLLSNHAGVNILGPVGHASLVTGLVFAWMLLGLCAGAWYRETLNGRLFVFFVLLSATIALFAGGVVYYFRDKWFRERLYPLELHFEADLDGDGEVGEPETPAEWLVQKPTRNWINKLKLPPEWGITEENLDALARRVTGGNLAYSRREMAFVISEEFYTPFSELLRGNGLLAPAPNKSYAWTKAGVAWCRQVAKEKESDPVV